VFNNYFAVLEPEPFEVEEGYDGSQDEPDKSPDPVFIQLPASSMDRAHITAHGLIASHNLPATGFRGPVTYRVAAVVEQGSLAYLVECLAHGAYRDLPGDAN